MNEKDLNPLKPCADALIEEIKRSFNGVSRENGVSWSESDVIDDYGSEEERLAARKRDHDTDWTQLIDDKTWNPGSGLGGYSFLDPIGFRYYLPPAMIRTIRSGTDEGIQFHLIIHRPGEDLRDYGLNQVSLLTADQRRAVARFLRYMIDLDESRARGSSPPDSELYLDEATDWRKAFDSHWSQFLDEQRR